MASFSPPNQVFYDFNFADFICVTDSNICIYAAKTGDLKILAWALTNGCDLHVDAFDAAAESGHVETVKWLKEHNCPWKASIWASAARSKNSSTFTWLQNNFPDQGLNCKNCQLAAAKFGNLELLRILKKDQNSSRKLMSAAVLGGNSETIEWLRPFNTFTIQVIDTACLVGNLKIVKEECSEFYPSYCASAARNGHFELLQWLHANGCPWNESATAAAAKGGHFEILKWLVHNGCPMQNTITSSAAVMSGRLEILIWLHNNGCPKSQRDCIYIAAEYGHLHILEWLWNHYGKIWNRTITTNVMNYAAKRGDLEMLRWGKKNFLSCTKYVYEEAALNGQLEAIKWLQRNRYPHNNDLSTMAAEHGHIRLLRWLMENGHTCSRGAGWANLLRETRVRNYLKSKGIG
jgi:hypothetical protein